MTMLRLIWIYLLTISSCWAEVSLLNFNTMCDICKGSSLPKYSQRIKTFQSIIKKYNPDLLSLQEFRSKDHLRKTLRINKDYQYLIYQNFLVSYPDAAIVFKKSIFTLKDHGTLWIGPDPSIFNLGWKYAMPRILVWAKLQIKSSGQTFIFMSTHLDNRIENLDGSAILIDKVSHQFTDPILFAGDTNMTFEMKHYSILSQNFFNAYKLLDKFETSVPYENKTDLCYTKKGKSFPSCLVEHILFSKSHQWKISDYVIDLTKIKNSTKFPSDHRPIYIKFDLPD